MTGPSGVGKTHVAIAPGYTACLKGYSVLFTTAISVINTLSAAHAAARLKTELAKYLKPGVPVLDEPGYPPIDKAGADLLFQIISARYERSSISVTSNRVYKK